MIRKKLVIAALIIGLAPFAFSKEDKKPSYTHITNVTIFDGVNEKTTEGSVLIENNLIKAVGANVKVPAGATVIDGDGQFLMPGIIEAHGHVGLAVAPAEIGTTLDWQYSAIRTVGVAERYLDHGWTTVRDAGGMVSGIKKAIDEGHVPGPRIYPSGMFISQTSGHGDFRRYGDGHPNTTPDMPFFNRYYGHLADGVAEVQRAVREELRKGSVHLKLMAGGGIASSYDPLHTTQYSMEELTAAVKAADDWGTYVMVHAYTDKAVSRCIDAGVKVIEHGQLVTDETAKKMAEKGVWLSTQVFYAMNEPTPTQIAAAGGEVGYRKWKLVNDGTKASIEMAKKHGVKIAFGTDLWGPAMELGIANEFTARKAFFSNIEILRQATSINGELLKITGPLNPYPNGPIGVIAEGAYADLLIVDGNPIDQIEILTKPKESLSLIMKDGKIYKNTLK